MLPPYPTQLEQEGFEMLVGIFWVLKIFIVFVGFSGFLVNAYIILQEMYVKNIFKKTSS